MDLNADADKNDKTVQRSIITRIEDNAYEDKSVATHSTWRLIHRDHVRAHLLADLSDYATQDVEHFVESIPHVEDCKEGVKVSDSNEGVTNETNPNDIDNDIPIYSFISIRSNNNVDAAFQANRNPAISHNTRAPTLHSAKGNSPRMSSLVVCQNKYDEQEKRQVLKSHMDTASNFLAVEKCITGHEGIVQKKKANQGDDEDSKGDDYNGGTSRDSRENNHIYGDSGHIPPGDLGPDRCKRVAEAANSITHHWESSNETRRSELSTYYRPFWTGVLHEDAITHCFPHGWNTLCWPMTLSLLATFLTILGSFSCNYFQGALIGFTGGKYGLWTLEDVHGDCQLWSVLFYAYDLGAPLQWARTFSMCAMVLGLAVTTAMAQAMQCHIVSWGIGVAFFICFVISLASTKVFNLWSLLALFTFVFYVLIVRALFVHPVARRISVRGTHILACTQFSCHICTTLTLVVLKSEYCTCESLSAGQLDGRIQGDPCVGDCKLHTAGYYIIFSSLLWLVGGIVTLSIGVQPPVLYVALSLDQYAHYSRDSITTRVTQSLRKFGQVIRSDTATTSATLSERTDIPIDLNIDMDITQDESRSSREDEFDEFRQGHTNFSDHSYEKAETGLDPQVHAATTRASTKIDDFVPNGSSELLESKIDQKDHKEEEEGCEKGIEIYSKDHTTTASSTPTIYQPPNRTCFQKCCCDFRVAHRTRKEWRTFLCFCCVLGIMIATHVFIVVLMIGSRMENNHAQQAPDTTPYFITEEVCAYDPTDLNKPFLMFASKELATHGGYRVAHCGACGHCSNLPDIQTYVETRQTIAASAKQCGPVNFLGTFDDLVECLQDRIPFSDQCSVCWAENMRNTGDNCLFTCLVTLFTGFMADNNVPGAGTEGWLNHCLYCDEKLSGPDFVTCSGVARRRLGIASEIERDPEEQCPKVDLDWVSVDFESLPRSSL